MQTSTEHTIVAAFRNHSDARGAADALAAEGFPRDDIYIESGDPAANTGTTTAGREEGGIKGWFKSLFGEEDTADRVDYERAYTQGHTLLSVTASDDNIPAVETILNRFNPIELTSDDETATNAGTERNVNTTARANAAALETGASTTEAGRSIPVVQEDLQVGKRRILRGGVRVYSRVVSQPVEDTVSLREERVRVERRPVNRQATEADLRGKDEVIEVQEYAEEPVVAKQARVVEEVRVGKDVSERRETVRDNVRHTEVNVDRTPGTGNAEFDDSEFRRDFATRYGTSGETYENYAPAYQYGYTMASDPKYRGRQFNDIESDLRTNYSSRYPGSTWEKVKDSVRYGWDKVTGKTSTATTR